MKTLILFFFIAYISCSFNPLKAQQTQHSAAERANLALAKTISFYDEQVSRNTMLYTGKSYYNQHSKIIGHQFFREDYWELGRVNYNGQQYDSVYIKYDIYKDHLLIENFNSSGFLSPIILYQNKVTSFDLMNQHFLRIESDTISDLKEGYYNELYKGDVIQVLVKRRKEIVDANDAIGLERNALREQFVEKDRYYVRKDGRYIRVKKKKSLLKVFEDRKKEVKAYIKRSLFQFNTQAELEIASVAEFYESLP